MPGICPRCNRHVYFAEEKLALGKVWHAICFSCRKCRKLLDSCSVATHRGELFCKNCYTRLFPTAALILSLPTDPTRITAISREPALTTIQNCESLSNCDCYAGVISENISTRGGNHRLESGRLRGGGVDEQDEKKRFEDEARDVDNSATTTARNVTSNSTSVISRSNNCAACTKQKHCRPWTSPAVELIYGDSNDIDDRRTINESCSASQRSQRQDRWNGHRENLDQIHSKLYEEQQQENRSQNAVRSPKDSDFGKGMNNSENQFRRVSFSDAVVGIADHDHRIIMQNNPSSSCRDKNGAGLDSGEREIFYDIWQADDSVRGSDDECKDTPRSDNNTEDRTLCCESHDREDLPENINDTVVNDGGVRGNKCHVSEEDRTAEKLATKESNEDASNLFRENVNSVDRDEYRMRGGCSGCCTSLHENVARSSQDHDCGVSCYRCCCRCCCCCCCDGDGGLVESNETCVPEPGRCDASVKTICTGIATTRSSSCCCCVIQQRCRRAGVCKKAATTGTRGSCGGGGYCGGGCRGGCGKPGQICTPLSRSCSSSARGRPRSSHGGSSCSRFRCPARSPGPSANCISGERSPGYGTCCRGVEGYEHGSPRCRSIIGSGCCINDGTKCGTDGAVCCRLKLPAGCECFGGGLDCRRCGRKVYQAEMQIASGVPYHSICFSCFCCRKPLESLTYQENCGEIYCKQCYVRNFGPQGYGYGAGAGVLQTPM